MVICMGFNGDFLCDIDTRAGFDHEQQWNDGFCEGNHSQITLIQPDGDFTIANGMDIPMNHGLYR